MTTHVEIQPDRLEWLFDRVRADNLFEMVGADETFLQNGVEVGLHQIVKRAGLTMLHMAAGCNSLETAKGLIKMGADVHAKARPVDDRTPLHIAASNLSTEVAVLLIENGASITEPDAKGISPIGFIDIYKIGSAAFYEAWSVAADKQINAAAQMSSMAEEEKHRQNLAVLGKPAVKFRFRP